MDLSVWLTKLDPNQAPFVALVWIIIFFAMTFFWKQLWPWLTTVYFPAKQHQAEAQQQREQRMDQEQTQLLNSLNAAIVELKVVAAQQMLLLQQHSMESRAQNDTVLDHVRSLMVSTLPSIEKANKQ